MVCHASVRWDEAFVSEIPTKFVPKSDPARQPCGGTARDPFSKESCVELLYAGPVVRILFNGSFNSWRTDHAIWILQPVALSHT